MRPVLRAAAVLALCLISSAASAQTERHIFANLTDAAGKPLTDLKPTDIEVYEGGVKRPVARATLGGVPMRLILFIDNSNAATPMIRDIRTGLHSLVDALPAGHEIMAVTLGGKPFPRVSLTQEYKKVNDGLASLQADTGTTVLLSGLLEMYDRFVKKVDDRWPVFVVVSTDGPESSSGVSQEGFDQFVANLRQKDAPVYAVVVSALNAGKVQGSGIEATVLNAIAANTRGHYDAIVASSNIPDRLQAIAGSINDSLKQMSGVYQIDYTSNSKDPAATLQVKVPGRDNLGPIVVLPGRPR